MSEEIQEYTLKFHNTYERLAPNYGYETRKDTKEFNFNSNNGKLMYATVSEIISPLLQKVEQLEKENKELKEENKRIFQNVNDDELLISNAMNYAELKKTEKKVEQLENIRKEAIEYITTEQLYTNYQWGKSQYVKILKDLLNILNKGE